MLKRKEMMSVLSSEDHAAVVVDKVEESTNSKAPDRVRRIPFRSAKHFSVGAYGKACSVIVDFFNGEPYSQ